MEMTSIAGARIVFKSIVLYGVIFFFHYTRAENGSPPPSVITTGRPGGSSCTGNSECYSRVCLVDGYCAPDGPVEGTTRGGSLCTAHSDCFSNYCFNGTCSPDSNVRNKVAAGGPCLRGDQCFSGYCNLRRCGPDSGVVGKLAAGAECELNSQCFSRICHCFHGYCKSKRCAPDGEFQGKGPGGAYCENDAKCDSGSCHDNRCAPESLREPGKVVDGGPCDNNSHCHKGSQCYLQMCTPNEPSQAQQERTTKVTYILTKDAPLKSQAGAHCDTPANCQSNLCVYGRCAPPGGYDPTKVADGASCDENILAGQCHSGYCSEHVCTVSYPGRASIAAAAAGSPCDSDDICNSGLCSNFKCSADSPTRNPTITPMSPHRHRHHVAGGGVCLENADCYSGYCDNGRCGADGPKKGTLASGGMCRNDTQCYSKYCYLNRCVASAGGGQQGKVAAGARCPNTESCALGSSCVNSYCHLERILHRQHMWDFSRPLLGSVEVNGSCWHNALCRVGRCLEHRCTVHWWPVKTAGSNCILCWNGLLILALFTQVIRP